MTNQITTQTKQLKQVEKSGSTFLTSETNDGCVVYVWQNGYDDNLVQVVKNGHLIEQQRGSMNEVVDWLTPLGVYDEIS